MASAVTVTGNTSPLLAIRVIITDGDAGSQDWTTTRPLKLVDAVCIKTVGAGNAGNTVTVGNGANTVFGSIGGVFGMVLNADTSVTRPNGRVTANEDIAAGGTLRVTLAKVGGTLDGELYLLCTGS